MVNIAKK